MGLLKNLFGKEHNRDQHKTYEAIPDDNGLTYSNTPVDCVYVAGTSRHQGKIEELEGDAVQLRIVHSKDAVLPNKNWHTPNNPYSLVNSRNELIGELTDHSFSLAGYSVGDYATVIIGQPRSAHEEYSLGVVPKER